MKEILIVEDHPLTRRGLILTIESDPTLKVIAQAPGGVEALELLESLTPDLAIVDLQLPDMRGLDLIQCIHRRQPDLPVLVVSRHEEPICATQAFRAGAQGYVSKLESGDIVVEAVRKVLKGGLFLSASMQEALLMDMVAEPDAAERAPFKILSEREQEVFQLTGQGLASQEIADRLHLSVKTIESYRRRIKEKLHLSNTPKLIQHAVRWVEDYESC